MTFKTTVEKSIKSITFVAIGCILFLQLLIINGDIMTTYYVSTAGNNSNSGTSSNPLKSIQEAVNRATAGDTVLVKAGTYNRVNVYNKNGTQSKPITIAAAPGDKGEVTINDIEYESDEWIKGITIKNSSNIIVKDFNITKALEGISVQKSKYITLQGNKIYDVGQAGLKVSSNSSYVDILNNTIFDTGNRIGRWGEGIYIGSGATGPDRTNNILIKGNDISKTISEGIDIKAFVSDVIIENNLVHDMEVEHTGALAIGLKHRVEGGNFTNADNVIVRNNKLWNISTKNKYSDGNAINASSSATIYNNVIWNYEHRGIYIHRAPSNNEFKVYHNTVYPGDQFSSTLHDIYISKKTSASNVKFDIQNNIGYEGGNNISGTEKLFVDAKNGNFKLVPNTPAVDMGIKLSGVKTDLASSSRIQGGAPDLGAYEYSSSPSTKDNPPALPKDNPSALPKDNPSTPTEDNLARIQNGLQVLYTFDAGKGNTVFDVSKVDNPINLTIDNPQNVTWGNGTLAVDASTLISSQNPATKLNQAIAQSNELTIEAWVISEDEDQAGPARMVTLSDNISNRNFTLGQRNDTYDVRLRTTVTGNNGNKLSLSTPTGVVAEDELTHIVYTRDTSGKANLYVDSELVTSDQIAGNSSNWDLNYELGLASELTGDRPWTGTYDLVAVYDQALSSEEVTQNFLYGSQVSVV